MHEEIKDLLDTANCRVVAIDVKARFEFDVVGPIHRGRRCGREDRFAGAVRDWRRIELVEHSPADEGATRSKSQHATGRLSCCGLTDRGRRCRSTPRTNDPARRAKRYESRPERRVRTGRAVWFRDPHGRRFKDRRIDANATRSREQVRTRCLRVRFGLATTGRSRSDGGTLLADRCGRSKVGSVNEDSSRPDLRFTIVGSSDRLGFRHTTAIPPSRSTASFAFTSTSA